MVPLTAKLKTGDVVEIVTNPNSFGPSRDWIKIVKTNKARNRIRQFLKNQDKELSVNRAVNFWWIISKTKAMWLTNT